MHSLSSRSTSPLSASLAGAQPPRRSASTAMRCGLSWTASSSIRPSICSAAQLEPRGWRKNHLSGDAALIANATAVTVLDRCYEYNIS